MAHFSLPRPSGTPSKRRGISAPVKQDLYGIFCQRVTDETRQQVADQLEILQNNGQAQWV